MKVEVFYFDGCPNHRPAVERVKEILEEEGVAAELDRRVVGFSSGFPVVDRHGAVRHCGAIDLDEDRPVAHDELVEFFDRFPLGRLERVEFGCQLIG